MGDPPKLRNKFEKPKMLWDVERLESEKGMKKEFGLKNMRELWIASLELKKYRREARRLLSLTEQEREKDAKRTLSKLARLGLLNEGASLDDILSLGVRDLLNRRLQTLVLRKGLAKTLRQSRQLITHGFVSLSSRKVSAPGYIVDIEEEKTLAYARQIDLEAKPPKAAEPEKKEEAPASGYSEPTK